MVTELVADYWPTSHQLAAALSLTVKITSKSGFTFDYCDNTNQSVPANSILSAIMTILLVKD